MWCELGNFVPSWLVSLMSYSLLFFLVSSVQQEQVAKFNVLKYIYSILCENIYGFPGTLFPWKED